LSETTKVTVTIHHTGDTPSGPFELRIGIRQNEGAGLHQDIPVASMGPANRTVTKTYTFGGTNWDCAYGNADVDKIVDETDEGNNAGDCNQFPVRAVQGSRYQTVQGVFNPGDDAEVVALSCDAPWWCDVHFSRNQVSLGPDESAGIWVTFELHPDFVGREDIVVIGEFQDGTPGVLHWVYDMCAGCIRREQIGHEE
jgi:hypothetical protein